MRYATAFWVLLLLIILTPLPSSGVERAPLPVVAANNNRTPAGILKDGVLNVRLELRQARWYAEAEDGVYENVYAFAEQGHAPQIPGPLLRIPEGTRVHASIHNLLPVGAKIYGLHAHPADQDDPIQVPADDSREVEFEAGEPGTYMYGGTTTDAHIENAEERIGEETLLGGALVVDSPGAREDDRIFVISALVPPGVFGGASAIVAIDGKSWPETERLTYELGDTVHWRIINATPRVDAMHLHGFYFTVDGVGDLGHFVSYSPALRRNAVTEGIDPGHTFNMTWTPERAGNWLFHCHMMLHMSPSPMLHPPAAKLDAEHEHSAGMGGLVLGITVLAPAESDVPHADVNHARKLQLVISENPEKIPLYRIDVNDPAAPHKPEDKKQPALLGPPIILQRGEPVEIEIRNQSSNPTSIHWHGIELESYYDGVAGWSGSMQQTMPPIAPGSSFVARFTPPRAGTLIYHTHWHDATQIQNGLYGPLIVLEPGQKFDADTDRPFVFSVGIYPPLGFMLLINGQPGPDPIPLHLGKRYRFRLINITDEASDLRVRFLSKDGPVSWKVVAKDGADLPTAQITDSSADMFLPVGSTCDVEVTLNKAGLQQLLVSSEILEAVSLFPFLAVK
jgi:FtsP/CotA-like multicopper oxidase with cupredoxin domain